MRVWANWEGSELTYLCGGPFRNPPGTFKRAVIMSSCHDDNDNNGGNEEDEHEDHNAKMTRMTGSRGQLKGYELVPLGSN